MAGDAWDPASSGIAEYTLSNSNKTATVTTAVATKYLFSITSYTTGKFYVELTTTTLTAPGVLLGFGDTALNSYHEVQKSGAWDDSLFASGSVATFTNGSVVGAAIDLTGGLIWWRTGAGNWNNSGTANPATGTGGITLPTFFAGVHVYILTGSATTGDVVTINTGATFANAAPSGFSSWFAAATGGPFGQTDWPNPQRPRLNQFGFQSPLTGLLKTSLPNAWNNKPVGASAITYSNGNKTAVLTTSGNSSVVSQTSQTASGKWYLEFKSVGGIADGSINIGMSDATDANNFSLGDNGGWTDTTFGGLGTLTTYTAGDVVGLAVDFTNHLAWWKNITQNGNWNQSAPANPSTNTGGTTFSTGLFTTAYAFMNSTSGGEGATINTGDTLFAGTLPTGFSAWFGTANNVTAAPFVQKAIEVPQLRKRLPADQTGYIDASEFWLFPTPSAPFGQTNWPNPQLLKRLPADQLGYIDGSETWLFSPPLAPFFQTDWPNPVRARLVQPPTYSTARGLYSTVVNLLSLTVATVSAVSVLKSVGKLTPVSSASAVSLVKQAGKVLSISSASAVSAIKSVGKTLSVSSASAVSAIKSVGKVLAVSTSSAVTIAAAHINARTLSITTSSAVSLLKQVGKVLAISGSSAVSRTLLVNKILSLTSTGATSVTAIKVKIVNVTVATASAVTHVLSVGKVLAISSASTVSRVVTVGTHLAVATSSAVSAVKSVGKKLSLTTISTVVATAIKVKIVNVTVATTSTVTRVLSTLKAAPVSTTSAVSAVRAMTRHISLATTGAVAATKIAGKVLSISSASAVTAAIGRVYQRTLSITTSSAVSVGRAIGKLVALVSTAVVRVTFPLSGLLPRPAYAYHLIGSSLMTVHDPITFYCGDSWEMTGPLLDSLGQPLPLTGAAITWVLDDTSRNNISTLTVGNGITIIDPNAAIIIVALPPSVTLGIVPGNYIDWLRITLADGSKLTEWTGLIRARSGPV